MVLWPTNKESLGQLSMVRKLMGLITIKIILRTIKNIIYVKSIVPEQNVNFSAKYVAVSIFYTSLFSCLQESNKDKPDKPKSKGSKNVSDVLYSQSERLSMSAMRQKLDNVKGCDWFQEISITIRKSKKSPVPKDRYVPHLSNHQ